MESSCQVGGTGKTILFLKEDISSPSTRFSHPHPCFRGKKRSAGEGSSQAAKRLATSSDNQIDLDSLGPIDVKVGKSSRQQPNVPSYDESFLTQVGDFLILKSENEPTKNGEAKPPLWRVDGKTLIQKYECTDKVD